MKKYLILGVGLLILSCTRTANRLPYFDSPDFTPKWSKGTHKIPSFQFINQNGDSVSNEDYKGKIYIADFFFTSCPGICPKLTKHMKILQNIYREYDDILLLSHTVMPWHDSVSVLKQYEIKNDINGAKWNLVTGNKEELYKIAREGYFADEDFTKTTDDTQFIHTENFILVDGEGFIRGVYNGTLEVEIERLKRHLYILNESSVELKDIPTDIQS